MCFIVLKKISILRLKWQFIRTFYRVYQPELYALLKANFQTWDSTNIFIKIIIWAHQIQFKYIYENFPNQPESSETCNWKFKRYIAHCFVREPFNLKHSGTINVGRIYFNHVIKWKKGYYNLFKILSKLCKYNRLFWTIFSYLIQNIWIGTVLEVSFS